MKKIFTIALLGMGIGSLASAATNSQDGNNINHDGDRVTGSQNINRDNKLLAQDAANAAKADALSDDRSPKKICQLVVDAAKGGDLATVRLLTSSKVKANELPDMRQTTCEREELSKTHGIVEAKDGEGQTWFLPFLRTSEGWKFDTQTFTSFYRPVHLSKG